MKLEDELTDSLLKLSLELVNSLLGLLEMRLRDAQFVLGGRAACLFDGRRSRHDVDEHREEHQGKGE